MMDTDMNAEQLREHLYEKYIAPTEKRRETCIGVEIEIPTVNLLGGATDQNVAKGAFSEFIRHFGFRSCGEDWYGNCYSATDPVTGDNISFDCSYNNLEFSFGKEKGLGPIQERFTGYIRYLNGLLEKEHHTLTGMGINPHYHANRKEYLPVPRYQMLEGYLRRSRDWKLPMYLHPYPEFGTYASASQVQLDVSRDSLISTIRAHSLLEPVKSVLFANAWMEDEPELLCVRDLFWENSTHGINPHNIGMYERIPENVEELLDYISGTSIFCTERDGKYCHFVPIPIEEYFNYRQIEGEYFWEGVYHPYSFAPRDEDLKYLRTYKFEDVTWRGTIEYRSCCSQPFSDAMTVAAFHLGLVEKTDELNELLDQDHVLYHHGYSAGELRKILNHRKWPEFIDHDRLSSLCLQVLNLADAGLRERGLGEEIFLKPLYRRAEKLSSPARKLVVGLESGHSLQEYILEYAQL
ncbi:MAG: glutamylcysteine synthetase [Blautia sp.]|nr:glutamylcysteine synthetase [Blautia sp.]